VRAAGAYGALRAILDAVPAVPSAAPLTDFLQLVVDQARDVVGCRYAAVSMPSDDGSAALFVTSGVTAEAAERVGRLPRNVGLLGLVVSEGQLVRTADVPTDPHAIGLPPGHLPIHALLGVPVARGGITLGGLFLADPFDRTEFDAEDETIGRAVASAAAVYLERAWAHAQFEQRQRWLTEAAGLTRDLLAGTHDDPLQLIADRIRELGAADEVLVARPGPEPGSFVVDVGSGVHAQPLRGRTMAVSGTLGRELLETGEAVLIDSIADTDIPEALHRMLDTDSSVIVPLRGVGADRSLLGLGRRPGRPGFTPTEVELATVFADQVALALEFAESRARRERLALFEDRERIARDLHDHVIQRLFAIGLSVERTAAQLPAAAAASLADDIEDIDATIARIRSTIHRLGRPLTSEGSLLRVHAEEMIASLEPALGFRPDLELLGPIDFGPDSELVDDCVAVLREALANVARHAHATHASVHIALLDDRVTLTVRDDGRGLDHAVRRSGLTNLRIRAERRGGEFAVTGPPGQGTELTWSVPTQG
jgi:signal transduction histidine kinase